jgi:predicted RNA-binding protein with EMAP domain
LSDTRSDYRILLLEHAVELLEKIVSQRRIPAPTIDWKTAEKLTAEAATLTKKIKYSFLPPSMLADSTEVKKLAEIAEQLAKTLLAKEKLAGVKMDPKTRMAIAEARYAIRVMYGLPYRLKLGDDNNPLYAVDIECVEVLSVAKHPQAENLYVTRARGILGYTIITNLKDVKRGEVRAAAILPPREFYGEISEAMYCSNPIPPEKCKPGKRPPQELVDTKSLEAIVYSIAGNIRKIGRQNRN